MNSGWVCLQKRYLLRTLVVDLAVSEEAVFADALVVKQICWP